MNNSKKIDTREKILIEGCNLVAREGFTRLTLERVASEAGISRGGLLYHFPNKEILMKKMIEYVMEISHNNLKKGVSLEENTPGRWLRGAVNSFSQEIGLRGLMSDGLLATMISNKDYVKSWRSRYDEWYKAIENDNIDLILGTIIFLAIDGLWYADLLDLNPPQGKFRQEIIEALLELTKKDSL